VCWDFLFLELKYYCMKKILIIEDDKPLNSALRDKCQLEEYETILAFDGEEGLEKALKEKPDLILLDLNMPKKDGISMLEELRKDEWGKTVEVIVLTNIQETDKVYEALKNNVNNFLVKSDWKMEDVMKKIKELV
jgi:DNA-binding response OmpR family regulator